MKWRSLDQSTTAADLRPLWVQLAERREKIARYVPSEAQASHARLISALRQSGIEDRILQPGSRAPAFALPDHNARRISSSDLLGRERLVICFFRGRWCPFCVAQLETMNQILPAIRRAGAFLVAISPQTVKQSFFMADQHRLNFPLLSDSANQAAHQFGLVYKVPADQQEIYRRTFVNLAFLNGDDSWELPIPATYVLSQNSTVLYAACNVDYRYRPEPAQILDILSPNQATRTVFS